MARTAHTAESTASQGMKTYLRTCATSGIPHIRAIAEEYAALDGPARMRKYLADFGQHFEPAPKQVASRSLLERLGFGSDGIEVVEDEAPAPKPARKARRNKKSSPKLEVGVTFDYSRKGDGSITSRRVTRITDTEVEVVNLDTGSAGRPWKLSAVLRGLDNGRIVLR